MVAIISGPDNGNPGNAVHVDADEFAFLSVSVIGCVIDGDFAAVLAVVARHGEHGMLAVATPSSLLTRHNPGRGNNANASSRCPWRCCRPRPRCNASLALNAVTPACTFSMVGWPSVAEHFMRDARLPSRSVTSFVTPKRTRSASVATNAFENPRR